VRGIPRAHLSRLGIWLHGRERGHETNESRTRYGRRNCAYTILSRSGQKAYRFARKDRYEYQGEAKGAFDRLEAAIAVGMASEDDHQRMKRLKVEDLLMRPFKGVFTTTEVPFDEPRYAPLDRSEPCAVCGDMTMATKMISLTSGRRVCIPCSQKG
jgi:formylmethanofuran dehydrogenase subunit E